MHLFIVDGVGAVVALAALWGGLLVLLQGKT